MLTFQRAGATAATLLDWAAEAFPEMTAANAAPSALRRAPARARHATMQGCSSADLSVNTLQNLDASGKFLTSFLQIDTELPQQDMLTR